MHCSIPALKEHNFTVHSGGGASFSPLHWLGKWGGGGQFGWAPTTRQLLVSATTTCLLPRILIAICQVSTGDENAADYWCIGGQSNKLFKHPFSFRARLDSVRLFRTLISPSVCVRARTAVLGVGGCQKCFCFPPPSREWAGFQHGTCAIYQKRRAMVWRKCLAVRPPLKGLRWDALCWGGE